MGYIASSALETHKITDLVGVGSFVAAAVSLSLSNPAIFKQFAIKNTGDLVRKLLSVNTDLSAARVILANSLVIIWGVRLSSFLFTRVLKLGEDKRLDKFYKQPGESFLDIKKSFFPVYLGGFWFIQASWGFVCCLPLIFLNSIPKIGHMGAKSLGEILAVNKLAAAFPLSLRLQGPLSILQWVPVLAGVSGIIIETLADSQKSAYRSDKKNDKRWCDIGVWRLCRYPNYFGEMLIWWSIYSLCAPALPLHLAAISLVSPMFVTFLVTKLSGIPLLEVSNDKKYKGNKEYLNYKQNTPLLMPNFKLLFVSDNKKK